MIWDLEHQEQVGVEERGTRPAARGRRLVVSKQALLYAGMALVPILIFGLMVLLARR
jgi:hypothetical protein